ncbi:DUF4431 domain-containing protein [Lysobacter claricitrinus]|uniref:DUF4431 domain-containing protein n=1 Tax=Lysobacter claricitrinus TaxID=3367728 RepID=UPI0037DAC1D3
MLLMRAVALVLALAPLAARAGCLRYEPDVVTLSGTLLTRTFYGPPNFGEDPATDSKERQVLLRLDAPICTITSADREDVAEADQRDVTLVQTDLDLRPYIGKHVRVQGTLFHAITAHHHTSVLIETRTLPTLTAGPSSKTKHHASK